MVDSDPWGSLRWKTIGQQEVQQAVLWVLQSVYDQDFLRFSYGFRPGRSQHDALNALSGAITGKKVKASLSIRLFVSSRNGEAKALAGRLSRTKRFGGSLHLNFMRIGYK